MSTKVLAAGWTISSNYKIVAPSFVIAVSLFNFTNLSIPLGPNVVAKISTIAPTAFILLIIYAFPWEVSVPSFNNKILGVRKWLIFGYIY
jgi:hypothetical protein